MIIKAEKTEIKFYPERSLDHYTIGRLSSNHENTISFKDSNHNLGIEYMSIDFEYIVEVLTEYRRL